MATKQKKKSLLPKAQPASQKPKEHTEQVPAPLPTPEEALALLQAHPSRMPQLPAKFMSALADEVARTVVKRLPQLIKSPRRAPSVAKVKQTQDHMMFLDTSAIIDGRIFDVINIGLVSDTIVVLESVLSELKHIADSKEPLKKERGRNGLEFLEKLKKGKKVKVQVISLKDEKKFSEKEIREVDDKLVSIAKVNKGKVITCDYNLEKKATICGGR